VKRKKTKCERCRTSICCTYLTQQIDAPRSMHAFDNLLWQLSHRDVQLFQDKRGWFLLVNNPCLHLRPDGGCGIYSRRPKVCRDHSSDDCEFGASAIKGYKKYFRSAGALERYCREKFKTWTRRHAGL